MTQQEHDLMTGTLSEVMQERMRQRAIHGDYPLTMPDGVTRNLYPILRDVRALVEIKTSMQQVTWCDVLAEEFLEAVTEEDEDKRRVELIHVAAVAVAWAERLTAKANYRKRNL